MFRVFVLFVCFRVLVGDLVLAVGLFSLKRGKGERGTLLTFGGRLERQDLSTLISVWFGGWCRLFGGGLSYLVRGAYLSSLINNEQKEEQEGSNQETGELPCKKAEGRKGGVYAYAYYIAICILFLGGGFTF